MADRKLVLCNHLCFLASNYGRCTTRSTKSGLGDFYSVSDISRAKVNDANEWNYRSIGRTYRPAVLVTRHRWRCYFVAVASWKAANWILTCLCFWRSRCHAVNPVVWRKHEGHHGFVVTTGEQDGGARDSHHWACTRDSYAERSVKVHCVYDTGQCQW